MPSLYRVHGRRPDAIVKICEATSLDQGKSSHCADNAEPKDGVAVCRVVCIGQKHGAHDGLLLHVHCAGRGRHPVAGPARCRPAAPVAQPSEPATAAGMVIAMIGTTVVAHVVLRATFGGPLAPRVLFSLTCGV